MKWTMMMIMTRLMTRTGSRLTGGYRPCWSPFLRHEGDCWHPIRLGNNPFGMFVIKWFKKSADTHCLLSVQMMILYCNTMLIIRPKYFRHILSHNKKQLSICTIFQFKYVISYWTRYINLNMKSITRENESSFGNQPFFPLLIAQLRHSHVCISIRLHRSA